MISKAPGSVGSVGLLHMVGGCLRFVDEIRVKDVELVACQAQVGNIAINGMLATTSRIYTYI